mmetsp:Transcript_20044/g.46672  ORF Transcript_20044/g.46672 Transcript_20044/m.46672 type:complete len:295 (-) Transcript_20044:50-934(-)
MMRTCCTRSPCSRWSLSRLAQTDPLLVGASFGGHPCRRAGTSHESQGETLTADVTYGSDHRTLLLAEGNFSFALSLAKALPGMRKRLVCTGLEPLNRLATMYGSDVSGRLQDLIRMGVTVQHEVDIADLARHFSSAGTGSAEASCFDRIVVNFPSREPKVPSTSWDSGLELADGKQQARSAATSPAKRPFALDKELAGSILKQSAPLLADKGELHVRLMDVDVNTLTSRADAYNFQVAQVVEFFPALPIYKALGYRPARWPPLLFEFRGTGRAPPLRKTSTVVLQKLQQHDDDG